jgi:hypothetical protein
LYKITYWGVSFYPSTGETEIAYDKARIFRPVTGTAPTTNTTSPAPQQPDTLFNTTPAAMQPLILSDPVNNTGFPIQQ